MKKITATFNDFPYTADPYGYARRLTDVIEIGGIPIGGDNEICVQGKVSDGLTDKNSILSEILQLYSLGCRVVIVPSPTLEIALQLKELKAELEAVNYDVKLLADFGTNLAATLEVAAVFEGVRVAMEPAGPFEQTVTEYQASFESLINKCTKFGRILEIYNSATLESSITETVGPLLDAATTARRLGLHQLILSIEGFDPVKAALAYRWLSACLLERKWKYPIHLAVDIPTADWESRLQVAAITGSLLEDGIGDAIHISLGNQQSRAIELAFRIARRYTDIDWQLLIKGGIGMVKETVSIMGIPTSEPTNDTPVILASDKAKRRSIYLNFPEASPYSTEKRIPEYPFIISNLPDYRAPYIYTRREAKEIQVGTVKIGGNNPRLNIARLTMSEIKRIINGTLPNADQPQNRSSFPDLYLVNSFFEEVIELKESRQLPAPIVVGIQSGEEARKAVVRGVDALTFCIDIVGQIAETMEDLEEVAKELNGSEVPLFLISTHNAGQSWGSYDYWPEFFEAKQMIRAVELCHKYGLFNLILGIYTYNPAWNTQNYRLLASLLQEKGWNYPIHLIAPDLWTNVKKEFLINAGITLGGLLIDGIGDSVQLDYLPKEIEPSQEETNSFGFVTLTVREAVRLSQALIKAFEYDYKTYTQ